MKKFWEKNSYGIITILTIFILLGFSYQVMSFLIGLKEEPQSIPQSLITRSVLAEKVNYGKIVSPVFGTGRVISTEDIVVSSEVRGQIMEGSIPLKKGQQFKTNDVLIRIFDGNAVLDLKSRKSAFLQSIAGILPDLKVDYPDSYPAWTDFFKAIVIDEKLPEMPSISSEQEKIFLASRNILGEYYSIQSDEITLDKYTIIAPFNGTFTEVYMEVGAIANVGATLAKISRTDKLELEVPVEISDAQWIETGDVATVSNEDESLHWKGQVVRKSDFVAQDTQSMSIFVRLTPTIDKPMFMGEYLKAVFNGKEIENAMEIPRNAVFNHNEVFVVLDGKLSKREIIIHKINEKTLIFSGIEEGTEIVVEPLINAVENTEVKIIR
ncbi:MAG: efflux RND transporter periplasmic adaptor subunit [Candidatus Latescibacteria bacterium]|nr:efflux RND transporter periplasmic adaptor subunit [Candidatus Latescibacterota bacterium]